MYLLLTLGLVAAGIAAYRAGRVFGSDPRAADVGTALQNPVHVRDIQLVAASGADITLGDIAAQTLLVFFGFTSCPYVCPTTLARLSRIYRDAGEPPDVQIVLITEDPGDTPEETHRNAASFHPDFLGLAGDTQVLARAARTFVVGSRELDGGDFAHTDAVYVVEDGRIERVVTQDQLGGLGSLVS
jgi:protein SCO1/2